MARCPVRAAVLGSARIAGLALLLLPLVFAPALLLAGLVALARGTAWLAAANLTAGLVCSLVAWLFLAAFHLRRDRVVLPVLDGADFAARAEALLRAMGYEVVTATDEAVAARPGFHALLLGGGVHVALRGGEATLTGPRYSIERLRNRLRMQGHLLRVRAALDGERKQGVALLKRIELCVRLTPEQLPAVREHLLDPLAAAADVVCELSVLVRSEDGLPAAAANALVRDGLERAGISGGVHTDHIRLHQPSRLRAAATA